ncbi:hypothetical protein K7X08_017747 [Anisodus acutangulus]|uniref:Uncharacterized protein n=1 Tax=Anisodus acutangulus TaxID=402998 RepID=A0A9Q1LXY7_9SOLA|nr:hypothetical protein K7X08_017747 [Anisodus acutangulus]
MAALKEKARSVLLKELGAAMGWEKVILLIATLSSQVWQRVLKWQDIHRAAKTWELELQWAIRYAKRRSAEAEIYRLALAAAVHYVWRERNRRVFQQVLQSVDTIMKQVIQEVYYRGSKKAKVARWQGG